MSTASHADLPVHPVELLQWSTASSEDETIVALVGEVDCSTADALSAVLAEALDCRPVRLAVDVGQVSFLDSTGIGCLMAAQRRGSETGCQLVVRNPTTAIARIFEICGVDKILLDHADRAETESMTS